MKKLFTNLLLMLVLCVSGAWADGNKRVLNSQNYETATATDWTGKTATVDLATGDATYGNYATNAYNGTGNRTAYKTVNLSATAGSGYTTTDMTTAGYIVEFDMKIQSGADKTANRSQSEFVVSTASDPNPGQNTYYSGTEYMFALSQATNPNSSSYVTSWFINDVSNTEGSTSATIARENWYHYKLVVTASSVDYTITKAGDTEATASGSKTVTALPVITGFNTLCGRTYGFTYFDNLEIYDYTEAAVADDPTVTFKSVSGNDRVYTISSTAGQDLYYKLPGDEDYTKATSNSVDVTVTTDGTVYAYAKNGEAQSQTVQVAVTCGEVVLNAPTLTKTGYDDGKYTVTIASDQSSVLGTPTASYSYKINNGEETAYTTAVSVPAGSTITAIVSATGYTSASASLTTTVMPQMTEAFSQDYTDITETDKQNIYYDTTTGKVEGGVAALAGGNYYVYSKDGETAVTDTRIGFEVYNANTPRKWMARTSGMYNFTATASKMGIAELKAGQIIMVNGSTACSAASNVTRLDGLCSSNITYFQVTADGTAEINVGKNQYVYNVAVYTPANEIVGALDYTTNYFTTWNKTAVQITKGETAYYKFINHNMGSAAETYQNWYLFVANTSSENKTVLRADADVNIGGGTITANDYNAQKVNFKTDLTDATVELFVKYNEDGTLVSTAKTTKADGTKLADYIYTQTYTDDPLNVYVSVEKNWLEIISQCLNKPQKIAQDGSYTAPTNTTAATAITTAINSNNMKVVNDVAASVELPDGAKSSSINVALKSAATDSQDDSKVTTMTYDVKPQYVDANGATQTIDNRKINKPITFRLPIPASGKKDFASVTHKADGAETASPMGTYPVLGDATNGWYIEVSVKSFSEFGVTPTENQEAVSSTNLQGYKTFYNATYNYQVDANTTIYTAANPSGGNVEITAKTADKIITKGTPVILKTTASDYKITLTKTDATSSNDYSANKLAVATTAGTIANAYILAYVSGDSKGFGFYKYTGSFAVGDVYLPASTPGAKLNIVIADETTAVKNVATENATVKAGKYLDNGKLVIRTANGTFTAAGARIK